MRHFTPTLLVLRLSLGLSLGLSLAACEHGGAQQQAHAAHAARDHEQAAAAEAHTEPEAPHSDHTCPAIEHEFSGAEKWAARFDDPARDFWQKPDEVIARLGLEDGMRVADIGSGTGYFAVRIARAIPNGQVFGLDTSRDMVDYLNARAKREGLANVESRLVDPARPELPEAVDLVLLVNTYHHIQDRTAYFERLALYLKEPGRVAIVDFKPGKLAVGPPPDHKVDTDQIVQEMEAAGYALAAQDRELLPYQDLLVFDRPRLRHFDR